MSAITSHRRRSNVSIACVVFAALLMVVLVTPTAEACVCMGTSSGNPACQARWQFNEIFVGRVTSVVPTPPNAQGERFRGAATTRFAVTESFLGVSSGTYELVDPGSSCSFSFEPGKEYLVYANHGTVSVCSPTRKIESAVEDLNYLRAISATRPRDGRIIGIAIQDEPSFAPEDRKPVPFPGMRIVAEGEGLRRSATTGRDGKYEILVPAGKYHVHAEPGGGLYSDSLYSGDVELRDTRGCAVADFGVQFDGHINGRVVTGDGTPVPFLTIELTPSTPDDAYAVVIDRTDENGRIHLEHVPPGRFVLGFQTDHMFAPSAGLAAVYLPGTLKREEARAIKVEPSETVEAGTLVVPPLMRFVTLSGVVQDAAGPALTRACVTVGTDAADPKMVVPDCVATSADGHFAIAVPEGQRYRLFAHWQGSGHALADGELTGVVATADMKPVVIVAIRK